MEDAVPTGIPKDAEILFFGKHLGQTFAHGFDNLPSYAQWMTKTTKEHGEEVQP